jgi:hypothetical protein
MEENTKNTGRGEKSPKKPYVRPTLQVIELRPEERLAGSKGNCAACQGANACVAAGLHGEGQ